MKAITRLYLSAAIGLILCACGLAQDRCSNAPDYFQPLISGDGQRYPLSVGPLVWHLLGSGVYPVKESDGLTHLAFAMQFTNAWNQPATIQSVEGRTSANLEDIDEFSIKGTPLPMNKKVAKPLKAMMPLSRDIVSFH